MQLKLAFDNREIARVREFLLVLTKRRGQAKKAIIDMVQWAQSVIDNLPSREERYKMIETLREASDGKMFLEREYAQVTMWQAEVMESDGRTEDATKLVQEI